jgi:hypothetical protein
MTKTGWYKILGTNVYINDAAKYADEDITIQNWGNSTWVVLVEGVVTSYRSTLREAKVLAAFHANRDYAE